MTGMIGPRWYLSFVIIDWERPGVVATLGIEYTTILAPTVILWTNGIKSCPYPIYATAALSTYINHLSSFLKRGNHPGNSCLYFFVPFSYIYIKGTEKFWSLIKNVSKIYVGDVWLFGKWIENFSAPPHKMSV